MSLLVDVNVLLAYGWRSHDLHLECSEWLDSVDRFYTCPIVELGFVRISMTGMFKATFESAQVVLKSVSGLSATSKIACDLEACDISPVTSYKDTTDSYLVGLAASHGLKLATFDDRLVAKSWARGVAYNPLQ